ncbi:uncharacterized protein LOC120694252 isoform X5 [Panicum virgatum]|uniref:uncharacterized protein LOC120694087 isoform X6 n=1 Tax=Panicum virgatum TaxID=38727 RepID=UPI0019D5D980|nr:uncharacterized protein LOC120694087 isoform X6 [Panicum virgatum]XP_039833346.1 uncharacterized protein LOC120694252 isoform X5 [Panicum virgatum]
MAYCRWLGTERIIFAATSHKNGSTISAAEGQLTVNVCKPTFSANHFDCCNQKRLAQLLALKWLAAMLVTSRTRCEQSKPWLYSILSISCFPVCLEIMSLAEAMFLTDLELNTVSLFTSLMSFSKEPSLLPARISSLLLNDSFGTAVGMATNIPPHNLGELVDALSVIIQNPEATERNLHPGDVQEHVHDNVLNSYIHLYLDDDEGTFHYMDLQFFVST